MSPEQLRGDAGAVDVRTDVYALRVILWEVLAGRHPFGEAVDSVTRALQAGREPFAVGPRCAGRGNVSRRRSRGPLRIRRTVLDEEHQLLADAQFRLAECLLDVGKAAEVLALMDSVPVTYRAEHEPAFARTADPARTRWLVCGGP